MIPLVCVYRFACLFSTIHLLPYSLCNSEVNLPLVLDTPFVSLYAVNSNSTSELSASTTQVVNN